MIIDYIKVIDIRSSIVKNPCICSTYSLTFNVKPTKKHRSNLNCHLINKDEYMDHKRYVS